AGHAYAVDHGRSGAAACVLAAAELVLCHLWIDGCQGQLVCPCTRKGGQAAHATQRIKPGLTEQ
ncbi:MAG: hypothetical protein ACYSWU_06075, partial [Planctomycetota bacterium]